MGEIITIEKGDFTLSEIAKKLKTGEITVRIYLSRSEFSGIEKIKFGQRVYYRGVTPKYIELLKTLIYRKKGGYS